MVFATSRKTDFAKMEEWIGGAIQKLRCALICALGLKNHPHTRRFQWPKIKQATNKKTRDEEENRAPTVHMSTTNRQHLLGSEPFLN